MVLKDVNWLCYGLKAISQLVVDTLSIDWLMWDSPLTGSVIRAGSQQVSSQSVNSYMYRLVDVDSPLTGSVIRAVSSHYVQTG